MFRKIYFCGTMLVLTLTIGCHGSNPAFKINTVASPAEEASKKAELLKQCPPPLHLSEAEAAKLPIQVTRWGNTGPRVLVIHGGEQAINGLGGGPRNFSRQEVLGQEGWRLEVPDRPGFGESPARGPDDQLADARWIAAMLGGGANLWGHSFGGAEALLAAASNPKAVRSLVLIEPALWPLLEDDPTYRQDPRVQADVALPERALMDARTPAEYASEFLYSFQPAKSGLKESAARAAIEIIPGLSKKIGCGLLNANVASGAQMKEAAATVTQAHIPVLVITGGWSPGRDALGEAVAKLTNGRHVIVRSPNHIVMASNPDEFNAVVVAFMRNVERAQSNNVPSANFTLRTASPPDR